MKLKNEQEVENLSDSMQRKLDITRKVWTFKDGYKSGYHQAQQDLLESCAEGFEEWQKEFIGDAPFGNGNTRWQKEAWQAATLANEKKHQEELKHKQSVIDNLESIRESQLTRIEELQKTVASQEKERQRSEAFWKDKLISIQEEGLMKLNEAKEDIKLLSETLMEAFEDEQGRGAYKNSVEIRKKWEITNE